MTYYTLNNIFLKTDLLIHMTNENASQISQGFPFIPVSLALLLTVDAYTLDVITTTSGVPKLLSTFISAWLGMLSPCSVSLPSPCLVNLSSQVWLQRLILLQAFPVFPVQNWSCSFLKHLACASLTVCSTVSSLCLRVHLFHILLWAPWEGISLF